MLETSAFSSAELHIDEHIYKSSFHICVEKLLTRAKVFLTLCPFLVKGCARDCALSTQNIIISNKSPVIVYR